MLYVRFSAKFSTSSFIRFTNLYEIDIIISTLNQETQSNREKLNCACTHTHTHTHTHTQKGKRRKVHHVTMDKSCEIGLHPKEMS